MPDTCWCAIISTEIEYFRVIIALCQPVENIDVWPLEVRTFLTGIIERMSSPKEFLLKGVAYIRILFISKINCDNN